MFVLYKTVVVLLVFWGTVISEKFTYFVKINSDILNILPYHEGSYLTLTKTIF